MVETGATPPVAAVGGQAVPSTLRRAAPNALDRLVSHVPMSRKQPAPKKRTRAIFQQRTCGHCPKATVYTSKEGLKYHQDRCEPYKENEAAASRATPGAFGQAFRPARRGRPTVMQQYLGGQRVIITHNPNASRPAVPPAGDSGVDDRPSVAALQHNFNDDVRKAVLNGEFRDWPSLIRAPPNPAFALRTAARSLGSLPERHGLKGVLVWCPESWFGVARARCPTEGCSESLIHQGWYDAKLISDLDDSFYWWPRKLQCPSCRGRGLHCTYSAADAKILDQYDPFVKDQLERCITFVPPAEDATRNSFVGISRRVHELLVRGATCESIRAVRQMITEMTANRHHAAALSYYLYEDWDRKHPSAHISFQARGSDTNRKLLPFLEYDECVAAPHESTLRSFVCSYYSQIRTFLRKRMLMLRGDVLRGDATFKVPSKVRCVFCHRTQSIS